MKPTIIWTNEFKAQIRRLSRRYRKIYDDIESLATDLESGPLHNANRLQGVGGEPVFRVRRKNSSDSAGKSGGFRIIYYVAADSIYLLDICVRRDCPEIPVRGIRGFLLGLNAK